MTSFWLYLLGPPVITGLVIGVFIYSQTEGGVILPLLAATFTGGTAFVGVAFITSGLYILLWLARLVTGLEGWGWLC